MVVNRPGKVEVWFDFKNFNFASSETLQKKVTLIDIHVL